AMNMAPFIFWNLAFYTIIRTQLKEAKKEIEERVKIRDELEAKIKKKKEEYESSSTWVEKQLRGWN
ncbi:hypothetical protein ABNF65_22200, partial [Paenibacillus larvae]